MISESGETFNKAPNRGIKFFPIFDEGAKICEYPVESFCNVFARFSALP